jgi:hypothetical protein
MLAPFVTKAKRKMNYICAKINFFNEVLCVCV